MPTHAGYRKLLATRSLLMPRIPEAAWGARLIKLKLAARESHCVGSVARLRRSHVVGVQSRYTLGAWYPVRRTKGKVKVHLPATMAKPKGCFEASGCSPSDGQQDTWRGKCIFVLQR